MFMGQMAKIWVDASEKYPPAQRDKIDEPRRLLQDKLDEVRYPDTPAWSVVGWYAGIKGINSVEW